ncbi:hypothetical protein RJ640_027675 [Escallonia rubra]|uniref:ADP-ribosyl cyclase/cyclic ADP-ribose hydrolase n=1 Tax=Escallonia rubra TaxID=112253 RepID=A0AA88UWF6_9ASTE|nr:hypothetical protein RJ640_027675 [Escallonia rubra]
MASSSSTTRTWIYDVFLSFRGKDVRYNFVDHLYTALAQKRISTFKDDEQLETGKSISLELLRAIQESMIVIVVFSENYASSSWCLDELVKIIECKNLTGQTVIPVFYHVEPSLVRYQMGCYAEAFAKHEVRCKEKVPGWREALIEATNISGVDVSNTASGRESKCIQILVEKIVVYKKGHSISSAVEQSVSLVENVQSLSTHKIQEDPGNIIQNHDFSWGVFFYLGGSPPEADLLIASVTLKENPDFVEDGKGWASTMCRVEIISSLGYARATNRVDSSSGIEQDIIARVQTGLVYEINVEVRVSGENEADVAPATDEKWVKLQGKFFLPHAPLTATIRLDGSPPGTDIFVKGLRVSGHQPPADLDLQTEVFEFDEMRERRGCDGSLSGGATGVPVDGSWRWC